MKKNKGFTLIELLAVIIILAVIALIATPIVLNVVDNAKESARQSSVAGYADATKLAVYDHMFAYNGQIPTIDQAFIDTIEPQGSKVMCEQVIYSNEYGVVLDKCTVDGIGNYYFANGKTYNDENNAEYKEIWDRVSFSYPFDLADKIKSSYRSTNTYGVMKGTENNYFYKGNSQQVDNNFLWYAGLLWRILEVNSDNTITLISEQPLTSIYPSEKLWNEANGGVSIYETSYVNKWLNSVEEDGVFYKSLKEEVQSNIVNRDFCIGDASDPCGLKINTKVGLMDVLSIKKYGEREVTYIELAAAIEMQPTMEDFIASYSATGAQTIEELLVEHGCETADDFVANVLGYGEPEAFAIDSGLQYNTENGKFIVPDTFFNSHSGWLLGNTYSSYVKMMYYYGLDDISMLDGTTVSTAMNIRPVLNIRSLNIEEGTGTRENPFRIKEKVNTIADINVGDYIKVPCVGSIDTVCKGTFDHNWIFRVVKKENDSIKVVLNGMLGQQANFGSERNNTLVTSKDYASFPFLTLLDNFATSIDPYRYQVDKTYYTNRYEVLKVSSNYYGQDYNVVKDTSYNSSASLITVGEMFSGNDLDLYNPELNKQWYHFHIHNYDMGYSYAVLNSYSSSMIHTVFYSGDLNNFNGAYPQNYRPVTYLQNDLTITSGIGTEANPYVIN